MAPPRQPKKKMFDDRIPKDSKDKGAIKRMEKLHNAINYLPKERYPKMPYPIPPAATPRERIIIDNWKADQKKIREGPLFVRRVVDINSRVNKATLGGTAGHNAFTSISTYSARYERKYRLRPNQTGKLWLKEFLPRELWDVVDPSLRKSKTTTAPAITSASTTNATPAPKTRFNIADFSDDEGDVDEDMDDSDAERDAEAEEIDIDYEDDEEDDDDYNGEKYFNDGEEDEIVADDAEVGDDHGGGDDVYEREFDRNEEFDV